jgi:hypothetical protein
VDDPALFRRFADVADSAGALAFANQFGQLGLTIENPPYLAEPLALWLQESARLRHVVEVWDMAASISGFGTGGTGRN